MSCYLDDNMVFHTRPPGTSISVGAVLLAARHRALKSKKDLAMVKCTGKRMWMRVADPGTHKRRLSPSARQFAEFWMQWCVKPRLYSPLPNPKLNFASLAAADACAHGDHIGIGGWVRFPGEPPIWFSECFKVADFLGLGLPMQELAQ